MVMNRHGPVFGEQYKTWRWGVFFKCCMLLEKKQINKVCVCVCALTVLDVGGAEGLVSETISWMARRSLRRCSGLLMPISLWISVSDRADMMAPLFTLARHAATYHAGIPSHSCEHTQCNMIKHVQRLHYNDSKTSINVRYIPSFAARWCHCPMSNGRS